MWRTRSVTSGWTARKEFSAHMAGLQIMTQKHAGNAPSPTDSRRPAGYHPTATPPPLIRAATAIQQTQQTGATNNGPLFQNLFDNNQPGTSTTIHTPFNGASPAPSANMTEALMQIIA